MYDCIYWWQGGTQSGKWNLATPQGSLDIAVKRVEQMGYVAHKGNTKVGPPEGPPSAEDFQRIRSL